MSNDIFYTNISNLVTFYMGERPSADKFNAVNKYFSRGMRELATAIGDINDDGFPYIGEGEGLGPSWNVYDGGNISRPLDIVSLARLIGPASNLNARMHLTKGHDNELIQELIVSGSLNFKLLYPVTGAFIIPDFFQVAEEESFTSNNQYKLISSREVLFASALTEDVTASYTTDPSQYYGGVDYQDAGFNVIPDPNQNLGVSIELISDRKYKITFPKITAQQSGLASLESSLIDTEAEFNNNRYYELPKWLIDSVLDSNGNVIEENRVIPGNFLYLKNRETKEVYKDAIYEYESSKELIVSNIDLCEEETGGYSDTKYCVILTGTNITNTLDDLRLKWFKHSHDGRFGESPISFKSLVGKYEVTPPSGIYGPSSNSWNQMPMYLHRDGYSPDSNDNNGDNAMRGDLLMGIVSFDPVSSRIISDDNTTSHSILFGSTSAYIRRINRLLAIANNNGGITVSATENVSIHSINDDVDISGASINNTCETFNVDASSLINMDSEGIYHERSGVRNIQVYPYKIENNSIAKEAYVEPYAVNWKGTVYTGEENKYTGSHNINEIVNKTTFEEVVYNFFHYTNGEPPFKNYSSGTGTLIPSVSAIYTPRWGSEELGYPESDYTTIRFGDGLSSLATLIQLGEEGWVFDDPRMSELTQVGIDIYNMSFLEVGAEYWRTNNIKNLVEMEIIRGDSFFPHKVNLTFHSETFRAVYKVKPWIGLYLPYVNGGYAGAVSIEDHQIFDLTWMRPTSGTNADPKRRDISYTFNRWLPWKVNVLGDLNGLNENIEYKNKFYISVLDFPYMAYEINSSDSAINPYHKSNYHLDYSSLFLSDELIEIIPSISGQDSHQYFWEISISALGVVSILFYNENNDHIKPNARYLEVEEKIVNKTLFINIKVTGILPETTPAKLAMSLKSSHSNFVQRSIV